MDEKEPQWIPIFSNQLAPTEHQHVSSTEGLCSVSLEPRDSQPFAPDFKSQGYAHSSQSQNMISAQHPEHQHESSTEGLGLCPAGLEPKDSQLFAPDFQSQDYAHSSQSQNMISAQHQSLPLSSAALQTFTRPQDHQSGVWMAPLPIFSHQPLSFPQVIPHSRVPSGTFVYPHESSILVSIDQGSKRTTPFSFGSSRYPNTDSPTYSGNSSEQQGLQRKSNPLQKVSSNLLKSSSNASANVPDADFCHICLDLVGIPPSDLPIFDSEHAMTVHAQRHAGNMNRPLEEVLKQCFPDLKPRNSESLDPGLPIKGPKQEIEPSRIQAILEAAVAGLPDKVTCSFPKCGFTVPNVNRNVETHIYYHFQAQNPGSNLFHCNICDYKGQQIFIHQKNHHKDKELDFSDMRPDYWEELKDTMFKCIPDAEATIPQEVHVRCDGKEQDPAEITDGSSVKDFDADLHALKSSCKQLICKKCGDLISSSKADTHLYQHYAQGGIQPVYLYSCHLCHYTGVTIEHHYRVAHQGKELLFKDERGKHLKELNCMLSACFSQQYEETQRSRDSSVSKNVLKNQVNVAVKLPKLKQKDADSALSSMLPASSSSHEENSATELLLQKMDEVLSRMFKKKSVVSCAMEKCKKSFIEKNTDHSALEAHLFRHLNKPAFACRKCAYKGFWIRDHMKKIHRSSGSAAFDDLRAQYVAELIQVLGRCFPVKTDEEETREQEMKRREEMNNAIAVIAKQALIRPLKRIENAKKFSAELCEAVKLGAALKCVICTKVFQFTRKNRGNIFRHVTGHCQCGTAFYSCSICSKELSYGEVTKHFLLHHKGQAASYSDDFASHDEMLLELFNECFPQEFRMKKQHSGSKITKQDQERLKQRLLEYERKILLLKKQIRKGEKVVCAECSFQIKSASSIESHIGWHCNVSLFKCKHCGKRSSKNGIQDHCRKAHPLANSGYQDLRWKNSEKLHSQFMACFPLEKPDKMTHTFITVKEEQEMKSPKFKGVLKSPEKFRKSIQDIVSQCRTQGTSLLTCAICGEEIKPRRKLIADHCYQHSGDLELFTCLLCSFKGCDMDSHMEMCHQSAAITRETTEDHRHLYEAALMSVLESCFHSHPALGSEGRQMQVAQHSDQEDKEIVGKFESSLTRILQSIQEFHKSSQPKYLECFICDKSISARGKVQLKQHVWNHFPELLFQCKTCGQKFSRKVNAENHHLQKHGPQPLSGAVADFSLDHDDNLSELALRCFGTEPTQAVKRKKSSGFALALPNVSSQKKYKQPASKSVKGPGSAVCEENLDQELETGTEFQAGKSIKGPGSAVCEENLDQELETGTEDMELIGRNQGFGSEDDGAQFHLEQAKPSPERFEAALDALLGMAQRMEVTILKCGKCEWSLDMDNSMYPVRDEVSQHVYEHLDKPVFMCQLCSASQFRIHEHMLKYHQKYLVHPEDVTDLRTENENDLLQALEECFPVNPDMGSSEESRRERPSDEHTYAIPGKHSSDGGDSLEEMSLGGKRLKMESAQSFEMEKSVFERMLEGYER